MKDHVFKVKDLVSQVKRELCIETGASFLKYQDRKCTRQNASSFPRNKCINIRAPLLPVSLNSTSSPSILSPPVKHQVTQHRRIYQEFGCKIIWVRTFKVRQYLLLDKTIQLRQTWVHLMCIHFISIVLLFFQTYVESLAVREPISLFFVDSWLIIEAQIPGINLSRAISKSDSDWQHLTCQSHRPISIDPAPAQDTS